MSGNKRAREEEPKQEVARLEQEPNSELARLEPAREQEPNSELARLEQDMLEIEKRLTAIRARGELLSKKEEHSRAYFHRVLWETYYKAVELDPTLRQRRPFTVRYLQYIGSSEGKSDYSEVTKKLIKAERRALDNLCPRRGK